MLPWYCGWTATGGGRAGGKSHFNYESFNGKLKMVPGPILDSRIGMFSLTTSPWRLVGLEESAAHHLHGDALSPPGCA